MKNRITLFIGLLLIFMVVWGATLFAIKHKKTFEKSPSYQSLILKT